MDIKSSVQNNDDKNNKPQYLQIAETIKNKIFLGTLSVGTKLPPERELAKKYDSGRPSVREAIRSLENMGLVETKHGDGSYVANNMKNVMFSSLSAISRINSVTISEIMEFREMFEYEAVKLAAERRTTDQLKKMEEILIKIKVSDTIYEFQKLDGLFHTLISEMSNNALIIESYLAMNKLFYDSIKDTTVAITLEGESSEELFSYHKPIYDSIRDSDPVLAQIFMNKHFNRIRKSIKDIK